MNAPQVTQPKKTKRNPTLLWVTAATLTITTFVLVGSGYVAYQQTRHHKMLKQHAALLTKLQHQSQPRSQQTQPAIQQQIQQLIRRQTQLTEQVSALKKQATHPTQSAYLIQAQSNNLITAYHILVSFAAIQTQQLILLNQPKANITLPIQHLLSAEVTLPIALALKPKLHNLLEQIQALPTLNIGLIQRQLHTLSDGLSALTFATPIPKTKPSIRTHTEASSWRDKVNAAWHAIKGYLIIRHSNAINQALLFSSERVNALAFLTQALSAAQFAAWRQDQVHYQAALNQAISHVRAFCQDTKPRQKWLKLATQLSHQPVAYPVQQQKSLLRNLALLRGNG